MNSTNEGFLGAQASPETYGDVLTQYQAMPPDLQAHVERLAADAQEPGFSTQFTTPIFEQAAEQAAVDVAEGRENTATQHAGEYHQHMQETLRPAHLKAHAEKTAFMVGYSEDDRDRVAGALELGDEALQLGGGMSPPSESLETLRATPTTEELKALPETLKPRIEEALNSSEFQRSPELEKAIGDYYVDHNRMATTIKAVVEDGLSQADAARIEAGEFDNESYVMNQVLKGLAERAADPTKREEALRYADELVSKVLFNEVCVGAMTLRPEDLAVIGTLRQQIAETAVREGHAFTGGGPGEAKYYWNTKRGPTDRQVFEGDSVYDLQKREDNAKNAWEDTRYAGQLVFNNTPFMTDIVVPDNGPGFTMRSRSDRQNDGGKVKVTTAQYEAGVEMHTNQTHWSEEFMPNTYKMVQGSVEKGYKANSPATIAVPLAELVGQAPFGRDCEYGVVQLKADSHHEVPIIDRVNSRGDHAGNIDSMGADGADRVFFGDAIDPDKGHNARIDFGRGMSSDTGNTSHIIRLQGDYNKVHEDQAGNVSGTAASLPNYGAGENIPQVHNLPYDILPGQFGGSLRGMNMNEQLSELSRQIADMQRQSRELPQYRDKVVVPLRQGVMAYMNEARNEGRAFGGMGSGLRQAHEVSIVR